jgi:hypothetical protein
MIDKVTTCPVCCSKLNELWQTTSDGILAKFYGKYYKYNAWCDYCGWEDEFSTTDYEIKQNIECAEKLIALQNSKGKTIKFVKYEPLSEV